MLRGRWRGGRGRACTATFVRCMSTLSRSAGDDEYLRRDETASRIPIPSILTCDASKGQALPQLLGYVYYSQLRRRRVPAARTPAMAGVRSGRCWDVPQGAAGARGAGGGALCGAEAREAVAVEVGAERVVPCHEDLCGGRGE